MEQTITLHLDAQTGGQLDLLAKTLGFPRELAAVYAIRMIGACMREGLLDDFSPRAWPAEARLLTQVNGKVLDFPRATGRSGV